jgi:hypothetical protein
MVNRFLSSMGITLDNFGAKPLRKNEPQQRMVGPGEVATLRADNDLQKGAGD